MISRKPRRARESVPYEVWETVVPENSIGSVIRSFGPDVVVASSIGRVSWRRIRTHLAELGIPSVLYIREEAALGHLIISKAPPDLLLANSHTYAAEAGKLGYPALDGPVGRDRRQLPREEQQGARALRESGAELRAGSCARARGIAS